MSDHDLPYGITFTDGQTRIVQAPTLRDAEDRGWEHAYRLTQTQRGWRRELGVRAVEALHPRDVAHWGER